jgi:hypothetical protein
VTLAVKRDKEWMGWWGKRERWGKGEVSTLIAPLSSPSSPTLFNSVILILFVFTFAAFCGLLRRKKKEEKKTHTQKERKACIFRE